MEQRRIRTNSISLNVATAGPADGPLVILLHGFPEFWYGWRHQIQALAEAGCRLWVPDQRGYNLSDKPAGINAYSLDQLAGDVIGLIEAADEEHAIIIGHDWGGAVAWHLASESPQLLNGLVVMNAPRPAVLIRQLRWNLSQLRKSWYIAFFQLPWLPEWIASRNNWRMATRALEQTSRPGTYSDLDLDIYRRAWSQPGAFTSMINWYRAPLRSLRRAAPLRPIRVPTLLLWGARDRFLIRELARLSIDTCVRGRLVYLEEATHWLQHEEPGRVNRLILDFIRRSVFVESR